MGHTDFLKRLAVLALAVLCCTAGCKNNGTDNDTAIVTASPENGPTVQEAVKTAEQMLQLGSSVDVVLTTLETQMKSDPQVYDVEVGQEDGSISMVFNDGETHTIWLVDERTGVSGFTDTVENEAYEADSIERSTDAHAALTMQQQTAGPGYYQMPAGNKALLLNGYVFYHGMNGESEDPKVVLTDSTEVTQRMLEARGYKVTRPEEEIKIVGSDDNKTMTIPSVSVKDFENLTDYGVIVIETHGGRRDLEYPQELFGNENCGGFLSQYSLMTTEEVTSENLKQYREDVWCGRLAIHDWIVREKGKKPVFNGQFYAVTPNYIRMKDKGTFAENTLLVMNSCSAYNADSSSPMRDVFFDKSSEGGRFLGWTGKTLVSVMGRASLNLFQLMTASNEELTVKKLEALKKSTPPQGGDFTALNIALFALKQNSYLTDPKTGTKLELSSQDDENNNDLILMPHPLQVNPPSSSEDYWEINAYCANNPTATVGETEVFIEHTGGNGWKLSIPAGAYGDIVLTDNGRKSIPRPLHRWKPQIKIEQTSNLYPPFLHLTATVTLQARATIDSWCFRDSVWNDPPAATFNTDWDSNSSNIAWKIDGQGTQTFDEGYSMLYQYSGSGLDSFEKAECSGSFGTFYGSTVYFDISCGNLPYTMTFKGSDGVGGQSEATFSFYASLMDTNAVPVPGAYTATLEDDWSVEGGLYEDTSGIDPVTIQWNAFSADPPFDINGEPR